MTNPSRLIDHVQLLTEQRGVRLTPQRRRIYEIILEKNRAISAYDLLDILRQSEPNAKPPTIYRALGFLLIQGFIHKVESTNCYLACNLPGHKEHNTQLLLCDACGRVEEYHGDMLSSVLEEKPDQLGFAVTHHVIETHGTCSSCQLMAENN